MSIRRTKKQSHKIQERYLQIRDELWPELDKDMLWDRTEKVGFTTIPRTMRHIQQIMDEMSNGKPVSSVYLALWCRVYDGSMVVIENQEKMAFESGFTGQRAVTTWKNRMRMLLQLNFIAAQPGASGEFNFVLIWDPYKIIKEHRDAARIPKNITYNALFERASEIGADSDLIKTGK